MAIQRDIVIDGISVPFKASAALPRMYRLKFGRDIFKDFSQLRQDASDNDSDNSGLDIESLEVFENLAWIMAKHANPEGVPDDLNTFFEQFNTFSIYEILPELIDLWGLNLEVQVESKKTSPYLPPDDHCIIFAAMCADRVGAGRFGTADHWDGG